MAESHVDIDSCTYNVNCDVDTLHWDEQANLQAITVININALIKIKLCFIVLKYCIVCIWVY